MEKEMKNLILKIKNSWKSLTIWFNGLIVTGLAFIEYSNTAFPLLQPYLPSEHYGKAMLVIAGINLFLRFKTSQSLADK